MYSCIIALTILLSTCMNCFASTSHCETSEILRPEKKKPFEQAVQKYGAKKLEEYAILFQSHSGLLTETYRAWQGQISKADFDDAKQIIFMRSFASWAEDQTQPLNALLWRALTNQFKTILTTRSRHQMISLQSNKAVKQTVSRLTDQHSTIESAMDDHQNLQSIQKLLLDGGTFTQTQKKIFTLSYIDEFSNAQIGAQLGMKKSAVSMNLLRIRKKLNQILKRN